MSESDRGDRDCFPEYLEVLQAPEPAAAAPSEVAQLEKKIDAMEKKLTDEVQSLKEMMTKVLEQQQQQQHRTGP